MLPWIRLCYVAMDKSVLTVFCCHGDECVDFVLLSWR